MCFWSYVITILWIWLLYYSRMFGVTMGLVVKQLFGAWLPLCILTWFVCKKL
jgi:hypothetical protein